MRSKNKYPRRLGEAVNSMQVEVIGMKKRPLAKSKKRKGKKRAKRSSLKSSANELTDYLMTLTRRRAAKKKASLLSQVRISKPPPSPGSPKRLRSGLVGTQSANERPDTPFPPSSYPASPLDLRQEPVWEPSHHMPTTTYRADPSPFLKPQDVPPMRRSGVRMRIDGVVVVNPPSSNTHHQYHPRSPYREAPSVSRAMDG
ncbi:unnamed protein product [Spodoptera exigua]|nr:unnamed protein product [Spodoptera exigua]